MVLVRRRPLGLLLGFLLLALPLLAERGHAHANHATSGDNCQACQFWSAHQATGTSAAPQPADLPRPARAALPVEILPRQETILRVHCPRGPPFSS